LRPVRVVGTGGTLPAVDEDRLQPRLYLLDRLIPGDCREHGDVILLLQQPPQPGRAVARQRVLDVDRPTQAMDISGRVRSGDAIPATVGLPGALERAGELVLVHGRPVRVEASRASVEILVRKRGQELRKLRAGRELGQNSSRKRKVSSARALDRKSTRLNSS